MSTKTNKKIGEKHFKITKRMLLILACILLVITVASMAISKYMMLSQNSWLENENKKITEENEKLKSEHEILLSEYEMNKAENQVNEWPTPKQEGWEILDLSNYELENPQSMTVGRDELLQSGLLLINPWHPIPSDFENLTSNQLISVGNATGGKVAVQDFNIKLFPKSVSALQEMLADAAQEGLGDYIIRDAFRSNADQSVLFENERTKLKDRYSGDILTEETKKLVNYPGTSEYQSGLTMRVALYNKDNIEISKKKLQETDQGKWLTENSWKYGFVFRFPVQDFPDSSWEDKSFMTGVSIKLNAYRYVSKPVSEIMHNKNFVLEEFIEYMIDHPHIAVYENGILKYELYRKQVNNEMESMHTIEKPAAAYDVISSLDNMGGIISVFVY